MITIKDIAKESGVSTSTVSRYLNKNGFVSEKTASLIENACKKLNYVPNSIARSLRSKKTNTIALIMPTIENLFFPKLAAEIEEICLEKGYKLIICNTKEDEELEKIYIEYLREGTVDGAIVSSIMNVPYYEGIRSQIGRENFPLVMLDRIPQGNVKEFYSSVTSDHYGGAKLAVQCLIDAKCDYLYHVTEDRDLEILNLRRQAFVETSLFNKVEHEVLTYEEFININLEEVVKEKNVGVFVWNDMTAADVMEDCQNKKIKIPNDLKIVGYDDLIITRYVRPKLTSIRQPLGELGTIAAQLLFDIIDDKSTGYENIIVDNYLIERDSTK